MKILHTADIHIGYDAYGKLDPETGWNSRYVDFKRCFDFMVAKAIEEEVDVFLFCGDAYRNCDPTPTQQKIFAECVRPLAEAQIPLVMITGNHDQPNAFGKASSIHIFKHLEGTVHVFETPQFAQIPSKSGLLQIIALPWPQKSKILTKDQYLHKEPLEIRELIETKYAEYVQITAQQADPKLPLVVAAHLMVYGAEMGGSETSSLIQQDPVFMVSHLAHPKVDYVALGHIHKFQDRNEGAKPPVVYPSSIERVNFKELDDPKGFVLVHIQTENGAKKTTFQHVETPARRLVSINVDAREALDPTSEILETIAKHKIHEAIVRVRYQIQENQTALIRQTEIRAALQAAFSIAAIERVVELRKTQRTTILTRESSLETAMTAYLAQQAHLKPLADDLMQAALTLAADLETEERAART